MERYGRERVVLAVERVAQDFFLPSPSGEGRQLSQNELSEEIKKREPSIFFSHELCARYFTYMSRDSGAHFVLFDDGDTLRKKLQMARGLGITGAMAAWEDVSDVLEKLNLRREEGKK